MDTQELPQLAVETGMAGKFWRRAGIFKSLIGFLWKEKMWWLIPMILVLGTLVLLAVGSSMSGIAPFIYPLI